MRRIRIMGLCLLALGASSAIATAGASAALPELGRCVKVGSGGAWQGKGCSLANPTHNGAWEFEPGPGAKPKFEAIGIAEATLETVGGQLIGCSVSEIVGEWTGAKTASVNLAFHGCIENGNLKKACTTPEAGPQKESEIKTVEPLEGGLDFISGKGSKQPKVGIDLKSKNALPMLTFTCQKAVTEPPAEAVAWTVEGSVIGELKPPGKMVTAGKGVFRAAAGKQIPEAFEPGVKDVPITKHGFPTPSTEEEGGFTLKDDPKLKTIVYENEEPLEIKAK